jgi:Nif-specific regulatory protein
MKPVVSGRPDRNKSETPVTDPALDKSSVLRAVGDWVRREVDLSELLERVIDAVTRSMDAERCTIYLVDRARGEVFSKAARLPEIKEIRLKLGQGVAGLVAKNGQLFNLPRTNDDPRIYREIDKATGFTTRSMVCGPIKDKRGEILGVIQVLNKRVGVFDASDEELLVGLAAQIATVLESTSLYAQLRAPAPLAYHYNRIVGDSAPMRKIYDKVAKAAATDATVMLTGETGTGKGLIARAIHFNGTRRDKPFVAVDCAAIPETLVENELFGHEKGSFTGADRRMPGKFEIADGGTVFLDEIGDLPASLQGKLLRVIQDKEFERVGGTETKKVDVRIVAATHRNLEEAVSKGLFREDLYYRIRVVAIEMPPLRARGAEDLMRLVRHFLEEFSRRHRKEVRELAPDAMQRLTTHTWPGNIRELENCIESAVVMASGPVLDTSDLALAPRAAGGAATGQNAADLSALSWNQMEKRYIEAVLAATGGNRAEAARRMGIGRNTLLRKLKEFGL